MKKNKKQQISALAFILVMGISPSIVLASMPSEDPPCSIIEKQDDEGVLATLISFFSGDNSSSDECHDSQM